LCSSYCATAGEQAAQAARATRRAHGGPGGLEAVDRVVVQQPRLVAPQNRRVQRRALRRRSAHDRNTGVR
jgi:hypothetical protein